MHFCRNCGHELGENATFCVSCGTKQEVKKHYCQHCGNEVGAGPENCLSCGAIQGKVTGIDAGNTFNTLKSKKAVNTTLATIVGYLIPGLPSILWLGQKNKGIAMVLLTLLLLIIFPVGGNIIFGILGALDAYKLSNRVNAGQRLEEWAFFWK